jgi:hypothetical protein
MAHEIESFVILAPAIWHGEPLEIQPGDLSLFAPMGSGLGGPNLMMPWDTPESIASRVDYYGLHSHSGHPFLGAPVTEPSGGTIYFDDQCNRQDIEAMLRLMGVHDRLTDYAAFLLEATSPEERYLTQMRLVSGDALSFLYRIPDEPQGMALRQQRLSVGEVVWRFIEWFKREKYEGRYSVDGALGGDGDWARESLAFGFMVENEYLAIYRIWTRAWLVTK